MDRAQAQNVIDRLRAEIRRREAAPAASGAGVLASGLSALDALLPGGGFMRGKVVELCGEPACGKTTLALSALARATARGELCAFVDPAGQLYPPAARALGAELSRLLWVRPGDLEGALRAAGLLARCRAFAAVALDLGASPLRQPGPASRKLLEAAEAGRAGVIVLSQGRSGLDATLRLSVERSGAGQLAVAVERSRLGPPGKAARVRCRGLLGGVEPEALPEAPAVLPAPPEAPEEAP